MCNTRSKVYLQSMKTYILSVNTLTWNLTSERHDNCAPCLGLILPIRWVTPPANFFCLKCFTHGVAFDMSSHLLCLQIHFIFRIIFTMLIRLLFDIYIYIYTSVLSSTAFTYSYV